MNRAIGQGCGFFAIACFFLLLACVTTTVVLLTFEIAQAVFR